MTASDNELNGKPAAPRGRTRVLVIADDRELCCLIRDYLEPMGYEVSAAHSGKDGVVQHFPFNEHNFFAQFATGYNQALK